MLRMTTVSLAALALSACATLPDGMNVVPDAGHADFGAVSAADPRAQDAGEAILRKGAQNIRDGDERKLIPQPEAMLIMLDRCDSILLASIPALLKAPGQELNSFGMRVIP